MMCVYSVIRSKGLFIINTIPTPPQQLVPNDRFSHQKKLIYLVVFESKCTSRTEDRGISCVKSVIFTYLIFTAFYVCIGQIL